MKLSKKMLWIIICIFFLLFYLHDYLLSKQQSKITRAWCEGMSGKSWEELVEKYCDKEK